MNRPHIMFVDILDKNKLAFGAAGVGGLMILTGLVFLFFPGKKDAGIVIREASISAAPAIIFADIEGAVQRPGVYKLSSGSRVQDLLVSAGGMSASADREYIAKTMNLAAKLTDGGKIYFPFKGEIAGAKVVGFANFGAISGGGTVINLNSASISDLDTLSGIGAATAQKIIDGRPYGTIDELVTKKIVSKSVFEKIKEKISVY